MSLPTVEENVAKIRIIGGTITREAEVAYNDTTDKMELGKGATPTITPLVDESSHNSESLAGHHAQTHTHVSHTSIGADDHHAQLHKAAHVSGGGDAFASGDDLVGNARGLRETGGPTGLAMGAVADGEFLKRSGTSIIGGSAGGGTRESLVAHWTKNITKTNIGTAFVDVYNEAGDAAMVLKVDFTSKTQYAATINWNKIGAGTQNFRIVDDTAANVLFDVAVVNGENDVALASLPGWATGVQKLKCQAKSTTGADDPVMRGCSLRLK